MNDRHWWCPVLRWVLVFLAFAAGLFFCCSYALCYRESLATFYYDALALSQITDGGAHLLALFVTQFFVSPALASVVMALLLTVASMMMAAIMVRISGVKAVWPLAVAPFVQLAVELSDPAYRLAAAMAFLALVFLAWLCVSVFGWIKGRLGSPRHWIGVFVLASLTIGVLAVLWLGWRSVIEDSSLWVCAVLCLVVAWVVARMEPKRGRVAYRVAIVGVVAVFAAFWFVGMSKVDANRRCGISVEAACGHWQQVASLCQDAEYVDYYVDNYRNLALAHRGRLASDMLRWSCFGPQSLIMRGSSPSDFVALSDVYHAIGLLSAARFYAFQANEAYGDYSPRLLQRLTDISLAFGEYAVARKYINILKRTLCYRAWAEDRQALLADDAALEAHPEVGPLRACIFPDNRFIASKGIDDDIWQVLQADPTRELTWQYLGCFYILAKDIPRFMQMLDRMDALGALPADLPVLFQQAVCAAALASDTRVNEHYGVPPQVMDDCRSFWVDHRSRPGSAWEYLRSAPSER